MVQASFPSNVCCLKAHHLLTDLQLLNINKNGKQGYKGSYGNLCNFLSPYLRKAAIAPTPINLSIAARKAAIAPTPINLSIAARKAAVMLISLPDDLSRKQEKELQVIH
jgi:hypothetical protein